MLVWPFPAVRQVEQLLMEYLMRPTLRMDSCNISYISSPHGALLSASTLFLSRSLHAMTQERRATDATQRRTHTEFVPHFFFNFGDKTHTHTRTPAKTHPDTERKGVLKLNTVAEETGGEASYRRASQHKLYTAEMTPTPIVLSKQPLTLHQCRKDAKGRRKGGGSEREANRR